MLNRYKKTTIHFLKNKVILLLYKSSRVTRLNLKYYIQVNNLYSVDKNNNIALATNIKYRIVKDKKYNDKILELKILKSGATFDDKIPETWDQLSAIFKAPIKSKENHTTHYEVKILLKENSKEEILLQRGINIVAQYTSKLQIAKNVFVEYSKSPGILVVGNSGSGKSYYLYALLYYMLNETNKNNIVVVDAKYKDLEEVAKKLNCKNVASNLDESIDLINKVHNQVIKRNEEKSKNNKPVFLIIDEYLHLMGRIENERSKQIAKELEQKIIDIVLVGRSVNINLCIALQRLGATDKGLNLKIKDNLNTRIGLGNLSKPNFDMMFEQTKSKDILHRRTAQGYISHEKTTDLELFESPIIHFSEDF